ncbi:MAG: hypothetical protein IJK90_06280 [Bacteroidales bacterium]|nr:hypothetical protein [Bacteroidales bacterium]
MNGLHRLNKRERKQGLTDKREQLIDIVEGNNVLRPIIEILHKTPTRKEIEEEQKKRPLIYFGTFADDDE